MNASPESLWRVLCESDADCRDQAALHVACENARLASLRGVSNDPPPSWGWARENRDQRAAFVSFRLTGGRTLLRAGPGPVGWELLRTRYRLCQQLVLWLGHRLLNRAGEPWAGLIAPTVARGTVVCGAHKLDLLLAEADALSRKLAAALSPLGLQWQLGYEERAGSYGGGGAAFLQANAELEDKRRSDDPSVASDAMLAPTLGELERHFATRSPLPQPGALLEGPAVLIRMDLDSCADWVANRSSSVAQLWSSALSLERFFALEVDRVLGHWAADGELVVLLSICDDIAIVAREGIAAAVVSRLQAAVGALGLRLSSAVAPIGQDGDTTCARRLATERMAAAKRARHGAPLLDEAPAPDTWGSHE